MVSKKKRTVCLCNGVTEEEILRILKRGAKDLAEVKEFTLAASSCGRCKSEVETITNSYLSNKTTDLQQYIEFKQ